jgi:hypothetical protein
MNHQEVAISNYPYVVRCAQIGGFERMVSGYVMSPPFFLKPWLLHQSAAQRFLLRSFEFRKLVLHTRESFEVAT